MSLREEIFNESLLYRNILLGKNGVLNWVHLSKILMENESLPLVQRKCNIKFTKQYSKISDIFDNLKQGNEALWNNGCKNSILVSEGADDSIVALIDLWGEYLTDEWQEDKPIPIFIELREYYLVSEEDRDNYILNSICKNYLQKETVTDDDRSSILEIMKNPIIIGDGSKTKPTVALMINGVDFINGREKKLFDEINQIKNLDGVQLMVLANSISICSVYKWNGFGSINLIKLSEQDVINYILDNKIKRTDNNNLIEVLKNPIMLEMYISTNKTFYEYSQYFKSISGCEFKESVETSGEIIWNFVICYMLMKIYNYGKPLESDEEEEIIFSLRYLLPQIGYKMESGSVLTISLNELKEIVPDAYASFNRKDSSGLQGDRFERIMKLICEYLGILIKKEASYSFFLPKLRDCFAAIYVLNEMEISYEKDEIPNILKDRALPVNLQMLIGELAGEQYNFPQIKENEWSISQYKKTVLFKNLDMCRNIFDKSIGYTVWNIVEIWKLVRIELTGEDLSNLDLCGINLNGVRCSRCYKDKYTVTKFDGSIINEKDILFESHIAAVNSAVYSWDGKKILSASCDGTVKEWEACTGKEINSYIHCSNYDILDSTQSSSIKSTVFSKDGKKILSASSNGTICEWEVGKIEKPVNTYSRNTSGINNIVYSFDEKTMLSASNDGTVNIWDVGETSKPLKTYIVDTKKPLSIVTSAVYSSDGKKILTAAADNTIKEWDVETGICLNTYIGHKSIVNSALYNFNGKKIISASNDNTIKEWDVETGTCLKTYIGHSSSVKSAIYSLNDEKILSTSNDNTIKEWKVENGECIITILKHTEPVTRAVYSPDSNKILITYSSNKMKELDTKTGELLRTYGYHFGQHSGSQYVYSINRTSYSLDSKRILIASCDGTVKEYDLESGKYIKIFTGHGTSVNSAIYNPDNTRMVTASSDHTVKEWNVETGECIHTFIGHADSVNYANYCNEGKKIVSGSSDTSLKEWNSENGDCIGNYIFHRGEVTSVMYNKDNTKLLSSSWDFTAKEWDVIETWGVKEWHPNFDSNTCDSITKECPSTCKIAKSVCNSKEAIHAKEFSTDNGDNIDASSTCSAVYSKDEKKVLTGISNGDITQGNIIEWDVDKEEITNRYPNKELGGNAVTSAVYSQDGDRILSSSNNVKSKEYKIELWDVSNTENSLKSYEGHNFIVNSSIFNADGKKILSSSFDGTVKEWDTESGECLYTIKNIIGIIMQGCSFYNLNSESVISNENRELLRMCGVLVDFQ